MRRFPAEMRAAALSALSFSEAPSRGLCIDMGCGVGDYLISACPKNPSALWVGVDIAKERIEKTAVRLMRRDISNARVFCGDGQDFLSSLPPLCAAEIHINFPDPWLKTKQWKNRLFRPSFAADLLRVLQPQGRLFFVSDIAAYAQSVAGLLAPLEGWESLYQPMVKQNIVDDFPTQFYRKMSPLRPISYLCFQKR